MYQWLKIRIYCYYLLVVYWLSSCTETTRSSHNGSSCVATPEELLELDQYVQQMRDRPRGELAF